MNFLNATPENINKQKICNAINCYYSNEYMSDADYDISAQNISQCEYCAYNYDRLHSVKMLINNELKRFPTKRKFKIRAKFYEVLFLCMSFFALLGLVLYLIIQTKFFIK